MNSIKKIFLITVFIFGIFSLGIPQTIPYGVSQDSVIWIDSTYCHFAYYKPDSYDSLNSHILWCIHGYGGNPVAEINNLKDIADKRNALIVSSSPAAYGFSGVDYLQDSIIRANWLTIRHKKIYRHVINRENRDTIWVHLIGFSMGGQTVTRYMLIRQFVPDSIPIRMAVSTSPLDYAFPTEIFHSSDFGDVYMPYACGLLPYDIFKNKLDTNSYCGPYFDFGLPYDCNPQIKMYYNENYGVLIGTEDGGKGKACYGICSTVQGNGRYEKAQNFYNFADTNAITRGTTLKWQYAEVPGVGHNGYAMYNTKAHPDDTSTIAETLLFDTPYHQPLDLLPCADFAYDISDEFCNDVLIRSKCNIYKGEPLYQYWRLGDGTVITDSLYFYHTYTDTGTYTVTHIIASPFGVDSLKKEITITKISPVASFSADTNFTYLPDATIQFFNNSLNADYYYWDFGDSITSTDINPVHTYLYTGTFDVKLIAVNGDNGCASEITKEDYIIVENSEDINNNPANNDMFYIFPNPANNKAVVELVLQQDAHVSLKLYNFMGECIKVVYRGNCVSGQKNAYEINTSDLPQGVYFVVLKSDTQNKIIKLSIVK